MKYLLIILSIMLSGCMSEKLLRNTESWMLCDALSESSGESKWRDIAIDELKKRGKDCKGYAIKDFKSSSPVQCVVIHNVMSCY